MSEQLPDGLDLAVEMIATHVEEEVGGCRLTPSALLKKRQGVAAIAAIKSEHSQRVTMQHHSADLAQRIAELEAERDNTAAHVASIARQLGDAALQVDDIAVRVLGLVAERDALRARLAEIEAQEPICMVQMTTTGGRLRYNPDAKQLPEHGMALFARPVPAQAVPDADSARFRWLCEDHDDRETREQCRSLIDRLPVMSYSDAVMSIDAAMAAAPEPKA